MYQVKLPMLKQVCPPHLAEGEIVARLPTFRSTLRHAINQSGLTQDDIAEVLHIDPASFSRMLGEPRHKDARPREFPNEKLADFCLLTGTLAPVQWQAARLGHVLAKTQQPARMEAAFAPERARAFEMGQVA